MRTRRWHAGGGCTATAATLGGAAVLCGLTVVALATCGSSTAPSTAERFAAAVESAGQDNTLLTIADAARSEWDRGVLVCPYDPVDAVESLLGAPWPEAPSTADDGVAYVLLAAGDALVDEIQLDRSVADPCAGTTLLSVRSFGPTAVLRVEAATSGDGWAIGLNG